MTMAQTKLICIAFRSELDGTRGSGFGALKARLINMEMTDDQVAQSLTDSLHAPLEATSLETTIPEQYHDVEVHDSPCKHFLCEKDPHQSQCEQLVKALSWALEANDVNAGSLLVFTAKAVKELSKDAAEMQIQTLESYPRILGVALKKPMCQIFVEAVLDHDHVCLKRPGDALPQFQSSHELFLHMLREHSIPSSSMLIVEVAVWICKAFLETSPQYMLKANPVVERCTFNITSEQKTKRVYVNHKLPFGMETLVRDRKKRVKAKAAQHKPIKKDIGKRRGQAGKAKSVRNIIMAKQSSDQDVVGDGQLARDQADNEHDSGESGEEAAQSSNAENGVSDIVEQEEEAAVPMSSTVAAEEKQLAPLAAEVEAADAHRQKVAATVQPSSSYFSREIGLLDADMAKTGRAVCIHCKVKIAKDTVRFSWYYSKVRPSAWCHSHCLFELTRATGLKNQVMPKLREIASKATATHNPVVSDAKDILKCLEGLEENGQED